MDSLLAPRGSGVGLQALVPKGMRALTVEVNETTGVAGMITPGCHVDVVSTLNGANKDETLACTIVQDVLVQAVGQRLSSARNPDEKEPPPVRSVTLIATPRDAEAIELASSTGRTRLVLRGANDRTVTDSTGVRFVELRREDSILPPFTTGTAPATQPAPNPVASSQPATDPFTDGTRQRRTVTLIRGGTRSEVVFEVPAKAAEARSDDAVTRTEDMPVEE
jgi:pilus assembly protein CpaB